MIIHVLTIIIGMIAIIVGSWLLSSIFDACARNVKPDKFIIFWCVYSLVTGIFLIVTN